MRPRTNNPLRLPVGLHRDKWGTFYYRGPSRDDGSKRIYVGIGKVTIEEARARYAEVVAPPVSRRPGGRPFQRHGSRDGVVYALLAEGSGHIKIGFSGTPRGVRKRVHTLQNGCPFRIALLGYWPGSMDDELAIHRRLERFRSIGEWFEPTKPVMKLVREKLALTTAICQNRSP